MLEEWKFSAFFPLNIKLLQIYIQMSRTNSLDSVFSAFETETSNKTFTSDSTIECTWYVAAGSQPFKKNWDRICWKWSEAAILGYGELNLKNQVEFFERRIKKGGACRFRDKTELNLKNSIFTSSETKVSSGGDNQVSSGQGWCRWKEGKAANSGKSTLHVK